MHKWDLKRPLAVFDIEATGINVRSDRIVEIAIVKLAPPDGTRESFVFRVNPEMVIPQEAINIHGITNEEIADCPTFDELAHDIYDVLDGCDLCGYNLLRFDIPMLVEEFVRAKIRFDPSTRDVIDAQRIFHKREPRDLTAALKFFCDKEHTGAHGAEPDAVATIDVLEGQFVKYPDLPTDLTELAKYCNPRDPSWADQSGRLRWEDDEILLNFSKKKGQSLRHLMAEDPGFLKWMIRSDFPRDTREIVKGVMDGNHPKRATE